MANEEHLALLNKGVVIWNQWRKDNPKIRPNLTDANLCKRKLSGFDLSKTDLNGAHLDGTDLSGANLYKADLRGCWLNKTDLTGTDLREAVFSGSQVLSVVYKRALMRGKCLGIQDIATSYGDAIFRRDAADQDYLDALEARWRGTWRMTLFWFWGKIDYGRCLHCVGGGALLIAIIFGGIYAIFPQLLNYDNSAHTLITPFYYSIVTYTTLGFGDVTPKSSIGELLVTIEVIFGYLTLGLLVAVLAQKIARRS